MAEDRATKRREAKAKRKAASRTKVWIPIPEEFNDIEGKPWTLGGVGEDLDLGEIIRATVRRLPCKTAEDADRAKDVLLAFKDQEDEPFIEMAKSDYTWMITHFNELAHTFWLAPDARYLIEYIESIKMVKPPEEAKAA